MMGLNSSWSAKGKATSAKGKSISAVMTHHSADGSPSSPCHKPLPSLPHGYSTRGATCWEVTHGNNGFPYGLCTVGPPWKDMAWFGMNFKPWGRCSIFFLEFTVHWCFTCDKESYSWRDAQAQKCLWCVIEINILHCLLPGRLDCSVLLQKTKRRMGQLLATVFPCLLNSSVRQDFMHFTGTDRKGTSIL